MIRAKWKFFQPYKCRSIFKKIFNSDENFCTFSLQFQNKIKVKIKLDSIINFSTQTLGNLFGATNFSMRCSMGDDE